MLSREYTLKRIEELASARDSAGSTRRSEADVFGMTIKAAGSKQRRTGDGFDSVD